MVNPQVLTAIILRISENVYLRKPNAAREEMNT